MEDFIKNLDKEKTNELLNLIKLKTDTDLLNQYIRENKLPFCVLDKKKPFDVQFPHTNLLINLIEMIKDGDLVLKGRESFFLKDSRSGLRIELKRKVT